MKPTLTILLLALALGTGCAAHQATHSSSAGALARENEASLSYIESFYENLLSTRRPDLAARYGLKPRTSEFEPLTEGDLPAHVRDLRLMLSDVSVLPPSERADTLRARLTRELTDCGPEGALRRDPLLWLDIVEAAVAAPYAVGPASGCDRTHRAEQRLRAIPEALRGAVVLLRDAPPPDSAAFEARLARLEQLLRQDLPSRTDACKEAQRLAEFAEADTLAAASLMEFRRSLAPAR